MKNHSNKTKENKTGGGYMQGKTRGLAVFLSVLLTMSMIFGGLQLNAGTFNTDTYELVNVADPDTSLKPSGFGTPGSDGRVWVDKTVQLDGENFEVVLSALTQEYRAAAEIIGVEQDAADVAFVIDMSLSMTEARIKAMVIALNKGIEVIMGANPKNRIGIYYYSLHDQVGTLFDLASYSHPDTGDGSEATNRYISARTNPAANSVQYISRNAGLTQTLINNSSSVTTELEIPTQPATATQAGLSHGISDLINKANDIPTNEGFARVPYVMLFTDGEANRAHRGWTNNPPDGTLRQGSGANGTPEISALTILSAAKLRAELETAYQPYMGTNDLVWFNVAFGLEEGNNLATALLKPELLATSSDSYLVQTLAQLQTYTNNAATANKIYGVGGTPGYVYADKYIYFYGPNDLDSVQEALNKLASLVVEQTQERILPYVEEYVVYGKPVGLVVRDFLGKGMEINGLPKMGISSGVETTDGGMSIFNFGTYESFATYDPSTKEFVWYIDENEVPLIRFKDRDDRNSEVYQNPNQAPLKLTLPVGLELGVDSGVYYSNKYNGSANTFVEFSPKDDNPYYWDVQLDPIDYTFINSALRDIGDIGQGAFQNKSDNTTDTSSKVFENSWKKIGDDDIFSIQLGNNGKITYTKKYSVTFEVNGGTPSPAKQIVKENEKATKPM